MFYSEAKAHGTAQSFTSFLYFAAATECMAVSISRGQLDPVQNVPFASMMALRSIARQYEDTCLFASSLSGWYLRD